ncbi:gephyrin-like molybdotransferase Glp [Dokdonella fugitiva]|uniref:Molybdopterin molybdenumtransferase n=1 Tax=Dokdonella fugitiva TaxID=328517 RepID=A0A4R2I8J5_9GAMM|nr:gephyrin-like molybdotransferase Glp [Dokdonella fugitiva]TCO40674.1 molybdopterin molybdotransferase [Dokdonella fugitiva]
MPAGHTPPTEFATRLPVAEARAHVLALCAERRLASESVALDQALGRVLAADILAAHDQPPFANSAMDGYALRGAELPREGERRFRIAGQMLAGAAVEIAFGRGECVRITTGAPLPRDADTVVIKENVRLDGDAIIVGAGERAGANVRPAGEDIRAGARALRAGDMLTPARLGVLAACGQARAHVARRPRVALFVTGDELVPPDQPLGYGQIHDSNRYGLAGMLRTLGIEPEPVARLRDDPEALRVALLEAARRCDLVISSGGVSAGEADYLPGLVAELGRVHFWKVRMKPGMPILCGSIESALVFALPGNPVSSLATFELFVRPALLALQGANEADPPPRKARLAAPHVKRHERAEYLRARLEWRDDGACWATPLEQQGSGMLRGMAGADALVALGEDVRELGAGAVVDILPLPGLC